MGKANRAPAAVDVPPNEYHLLQHGRLVSLSCSAPDLTPRQFLTKARGRERFYWRDGRSGNTIVGMGIAADLMGWGDTRVQAIERQAAALFGNAVMSGIDHPIGRPRIVGGFAFRSDFVPDVTWSGFNPAHFVLPHLQLATEDDEVRLTLNALVPVGEEPAENMPRLEEALSIWYEALQEGPDRQETVHAGPDTIRYPLDFDHWHEIVDTAVDRIHSTALEKVVLARICEINRAIPIDTDRALDRLQSRYPECFIFLFEPRPGHAFFGATPELLVHVDDDRFESMGLAGSIQRGPDAHADHIFAQALLDSHKDRHEHDLVVRALRERLNLVASSLEIPPEPQIYQLSNIQHLYTPVKGTLRRPDGVLPLVDILHPTPALGGTPRDLALPLIRELEPVPRGWYAAPVGWIDPEMDGAFAVAIRSAVVQHRRAWLYAGAGIVGDSVAELEWEETGWKFRPILDALEDAGDDD